MYGAQHIFDIYLSCAFGGSARSIDRADPPKAHDISTLDGSRMRVGVATDGFSLIIDTNGYISHLELPQSLS